MTDPAALLALAAECEAAEGPDRELDARIETLLRGGRAHSLGPEIICRGLANLDTPKLTASVDAALALMADVLPDWRAKILATRSARCSADVELWDEGGRLLQISSGKAPTLPLAIVAALLRAVAARDG